MLIKAGFCALLGALLLGSTQSKPLKGFGKTPNTHISQSDRPPIFYRKEYNVSPFWGLERIFHPFDGCKYGKVAQRLQKSFNIPAFRETEQVTDKDLKKIHTEEYLTVDLNKSSTIARILGVLFLSWLPIAVLTHQILRPMRYATQGTIEAARLALEQGWAINLSGGYHHAKAAEGDGFCVFADIPLAITTLRETNPTLKVLIIDLDAHEGNGHASIVGSEPNKLTYIFDMYSKNNYPGEDGVQHIDFPYGLRYRISTEEYLTYLQKNLPKAIEQVKPDLIIYNAGSDIYEHDPLGGMAVTKEGIAARDSFVFDLAFAHNIPILMVLSGGYSPASASIIGDSLEAIIKKHNLLPKRASQA